MPAFSPDDAKRDLGRPDIEVLIDDDTISITFSRDISLSELLELLSQSDVMPKIGVYPNLGGHCG